MVVEYLSTSILSAAVVSDLMTGKLSVVMVVGKWSKNVVDVFRMHDYLHCFSLTRWMLYL